MDPTRDIVAEAIRNWDEALGHHSKFVQRYEQGERTYRGVMRTAQTADKWRHRLHPKHAFGPIETIVSSHVEMGLAFDVRPSPKVNLTNDEAVALLDQTEAVKDLIRHEHRVDEMDLKQRPAYLVNAICGRAVIKTGWAYSTGAVQRQGVKMVDVHTDGGELLGQVPTITQITEEGVLRDHSTCEVVDPRDWVMNESARNVQPWEPGGAQYIFHRMWMSFEQLKDWERSGFVKNVDDLKESRDQSLDEHFDRERELFNAARTKGLIEVLEYWCYHDGKVWRSLIGNRKTLLRGEEPTPFWHGGYPFVIVSSMPQPFSSIGTSEVELVAHLQETLWELGNQTLDNIELINNFVTLIRSDVDDPDAFELYPGARWEVDDPAQLAQWQPPYQLANVTANREAIVKGDLQNVMSAAPLTGGDSSSIDQKTATGVSLVMNAAQQRLVSKKFQAQQGFRQEAQMRLQNLQQFMPDSRLVHVIGPGGAQAFRDISILDIQGDFIVELTAMGESQIRAEKRAEASQWFTMMQQAFPMSYASGTPIDMHRVLLWVARQWGMEDEANAFFLPQQQPDPSTMNLLFGNAPHIQVRGMMDPQASAAVAQAQGALPAQQPNMGTTSATAVDASKPSATGGTSMSPMLMLQRALASRGGTQK